MSADGDFTLLELEATTINPAKYTRLTLLLLAFSVIAYTEQTKQHIGNNTTKLWYSFHMKHTLDFVCCRASSGDGGAAAAGSWVW